MRLNTTIITGSTLIQGVLAGSFGADRNMAAKAKAKRAHDPRPWDMYPGDSAPRGRTCHCSPQLLWQPKQAWLATSERNSSVSHELRHVDVVVRDQNRHVSVGS